MLWRMAPDDLDAWIVAGETPQVESVHENVGVLARQPTLPPISVTICRLDAG